MSFLITSFTLTVLNTSPVDWRRCGISDAISSLTLTSPLLYFSCSILSILSSHLFEVWIWWRLRQNDKSCYWTAVVTVPKEAVISEGPNLEDSLHHRFHLLRGKLGWRKVSLFSCYLEIGASLQSCLQCRYNLGYASTFPALCTNYLTLCEFFLPACVPEGWPPPCWPVSLLMCQLDLSVVIGWALRGAVLLWMPPWRQCCWTSEAVWLHWCTLHDSVTQMYIIPIKGMHI